MSNTKITGMGYKGRLPGDKKRDVKAEKKAREMMDVVSAAEKRGK